MRLDVLSRINASSPLQSSSKLDICLLESLEKIRDGTNVDCRCIVPALEVTSPWEDWRAVFRFGDEPEPHALRLHNSDALQNSNREALKSGGKNSYERIRLRRDYSFGAKGFFV